jgi:WD40 repeat protein
MAQYLRKWPNDYQLTYWTVPERQIRWETRLTTKNLHKTALSPDRKLLLATLRQRDVRLIECATGAVRCEAPDDYSTGLPAFLGDGRSFVVSGSGGKLSLWHTATGRRLFEVADVGADIESIQPLQQGFLVAARRVKDGRSERMWFEF